MNNYYFYQTEYQTYGTLFLVSRSMRNSFVNKYGHIVKQIEPSNFCKKINSTKTSWVINVEYCKKITINNEDVKNEKINYDNCLSNGN